MPGRWYGSHLQLASDCREGSARWHELQETSGRRSAQAARARRPRRRRARPRLGRAAAGVVVDAGRVAHERAQPARARRSTVDVRRTAGARPAASRASTATSTSPCSTVDTGDVEPVEWAARRRRAPASAPPVIALANPGGRGLRVTPGFVSAGARSFRGPRGRRDRRRIEHTAPLPRGSARRAARRPRGAPARPQRGPPRGRPDRRDPGRRARCASASSALAERRGAARARASGVAVAPPRVARRLRRAVGLPERDGAARARRRGRQPGRARRHRARRPDRRGRRRRRRRRRRALRGARRAPAAATLDADASCAATDERDARRSTLRRRAGGGDRVTHRAGHRRGPAARDARGARRLLAHGRRRRRAARAVGRQPARHAPHARAGACPSGAGSGVVLTPDGFLLTSAHVVAGPRRAQGRAAFVDGRELRFEIVGRDPLSDLAVLRAEAGDLVAGRARRRRARCASASSSSRSATRTASPARSPPASSRRSAARCRRRAGAHGAHHRQRDPDRRRAQPRQLRRRARRRPRPGRRRQHRGRRRRPRARRADQRGDPRGSSAR